METQLEQEVVTLLESALGLPPGTVSPKANTPLLGALPELDSMSVMTVLINLEERFDILIEDDEVSTAMLETVGALSRFLQGKLV